MEEHAFEENKKWEAIESEKKSNHLGVVFFCFKLGFTGFLPPRDIEKGSARNVSGYCLKETRRVSIKKA